MNITPASLKTLRRKVFKHSIHRLSPPGASRWSSPGHSAAH